MSTGLKNVAVWAAQRAPGLVRLAAPAALVLILALGMALRLWLLSRDIPTLDSDESMVGLMALHILRGDWAVFLWGQEYMGSLEAILVAPFLWLFGPSTVALRLAPMLLSLGCVATVYYFGALLFSKKAGLLAAALLALGSPFFMLWSVRARGGYPETLLFGNLLLLLALRGPTPAGGDASATPRPRLLAWLFGVVAGLALWTDMLIAPYLLAAGAIFWWQRRRDLLRGNGLLLGAGIVLGAAPAIIYNIPNQGVTVVTLLGLTLVGTPGTHTTPGLLLNNLWLELTVSLPVLLGGFLGGTQASGFTPTDYASSAAAHPLAYAVSLLLAALVVGLLVSAAISLLRHWRDLWLPKPKGETSAPPTPSREQVRRQGEAALLLIVACSLALFCFNKEGLFAMPRYLFPLYSATPLIVGQLARLLGWLRTRAPVPPASLPVLGRRQPGGTLGIQTASSVLGTLALAGVLLWNVAGDSAVTPLQTAARDHGVWISGTDQTLLALLRADNIHTVISNDYWEGLRLTFESGETIITVMIRADGQQGFNRYPPYVTQGLADPRPAYLELTGTREAMLDNARLQAGLLPGYHPVIVGVFTLFLPT
jgi:4-amino-4-deoxy-L-arabinose transferase-like glycosyltransferase